METTNKFITQGFAEAVGKHVILVTNQGKDGDIFVFSRAGKGLRKINHLGQSGEEYSQIKAIVLDEDNSEMFVVDYSPRKILVYDLYGNFKRSFKFTDTSYYNYVFNYDRDNLICYKSYLPEVETKGSSHVLISKRDGSITQEIQLPFEQIKTPIITKEDASF